MRGAARERRAGGPRGAGGRDARKPLPEEPDRIDLLPARGEPREERGPSIDRRAFLKGAALFGAAAACSAAIPIGARLRAAPAGVDESLFVAEALHYEKLPHEKIRCKLCPRECLIDDRERGYCGVRENRGGTYYTLVHSRPCTTHVDPVEKKPFFHFLPGTLAFSLSTAGCNVNCKFCQNWQISQVRPEQTRSIYLPPRDLAKAAAASGSPSIAYTYGEPVVYYEYVFDSAETGRRAGLRNIVITGGYIAKEPLQNLCGRVDAIKVDLKAFREEYYRDIVNGELRPVLDTLVAIRTSGTWLEIVYLVVPTLNDGDDELAGVCRWVRAELGPDVPLHFTRFHPEYMLQNLPPTPVSTLERAAAIGRAEGLHYVYVGNVPGHAGENTYCPGCGEIVIERRGFFVEKNRLRDGRCGACRHPIPGVWES